MLLLIEPIFQLYHPNFVELAQAQKAWEETLPLVPCLAGQWISYFHMIHINSDNKNMSVK